jgi:8-oxo-dGTP diphosphatase
VERDGNGWVECAQGHRHWGLHGAAGLLLHSVDTSGRLRLLLQHRADWCHHGGTWGLPGGARDSHESVEAAALREASEETALDVGQVRVRHTFVDDHGGWSYTTVYGDSIAQLDTTPNEESAELAWVSVDEVASLPLHPGFADTWQQVRLPAVELLVDSANVVGSVPDGWWADRAGATERLATRLESLVSTTIELGAGGQGVVTAVHLVIEGKARAASISPRVDAILASGSGDDAITAASADLGQHSSDLIVVTSDRGLRGRVVAADSAADVRGARWLLDLLTP